MAYTEGMEVVAHGHKAFVIRENKGGTGATSYHSVMVRLEDGTETTYPAFQVLKPVVKITFPDPDAIQKLVEQGLTKQGMSETDVQVSLPDADQIEFDGYEVIIGAGFKAFVEVGDALLAIRDKKLYRAQFSTFQEYCDKRWNLKQARAYQYMVAAETVNHVKSSTIVELSNEAQARELAKAPPELQAPILEKAAATAPDGKLTASHIKRTVETEISTIVETKIDYVDPETGEILNREETASAPTSPSTPEKAADLREETPAPRPAESDDPLEDLLLDFPRTYLDELQAILDCAWDRQVGLSGLIELVKDVASRPVEFDFSEPQS